MNSCKNIALISLLLVLAVAFQAGAQVPKIFRIDKTYGTVNEKITISGNNFGTDASQVAVFFGAAKADEIISITNTNLEVRVPAGATSSSISVTNLTSNLTAYSGQLFTLSFDGTPFDETKMEPAGSFPTTGGNGLYNLCMCDFNLDGKNDIVTTDINKSNMAILQNNTSSTGTVSFEIPTDNPTVLTPRLKSSTRWVRCGDLNSDGLPDLVFSQSGTNDQVYVFKNTSTPGGTIKFEDLNAASSYSVSGDGVMRFTIHDIDGDGKPEIIAVDRTEAGGVSIFQNTSNGGSLSFNSTPVTPFADTEVGSALLSGVDAEDLNGDGLPDIMVSQDEGKSIYVLTNASTPGNISFSQYITLTTTKGITNIKAGDMDGDGLPDIVVNTSDRTTIFRNTTQATEVTFAGAQDFDTGHGLDPEGLDLADMDGNGLLDIIIGNDNSLKRWIRILLNQSQPGTLDFFSKKTLIPDPPHQNLSVRAGDLNGDGKPDLAYTNLDDDEIAVYLNRNCVDPILEPVNGLTICDEPPFALEATKGIGLTYQWEVSSNGNSFSPITNTNSDPATYLVSTEDRKFYRVKVSSTNCGPFASNTIEMVKPEGSVRTAVAPVIINPNPTTPFCFGQDVTLEAENIPDVTFVWSTPQGVVEGTNTLLIENITAANAGTYSVLVRASEADGGCESASSSTTIQVSEPAAIQIAADRPPIIFGSETSVNLSVTSVANNTYQWTLDGTVISGAITAMHAANQVGEYIAVITNAQGCSRESTPFSIVSAEANIPAELCRYVPTTFVASPKTVNGEPVRYQWNFGEGSPTSGDSVAHTYDQPGTYTVSVTVLAADNTPASRFEQTITVADAPALSITPAEGKNYFCPGAGVVVTATEGFATYVWDHGPTEQQITISEEGEFRLTATTAQGCVVTSTIEIALEAAPEPIITASKDRIELGDTVQLEASGAGPNGTYRWSPSTGLSDTTIANPVVSTLVPMTYTCVMTNEKGCQSSAEFSIGVDRSVNVDPQKIFTPNNDGSNETWYIDKMDLYPDCRMTLFNRQGVQVYDQEDYSNDAPWDGTRNGTPLPDGVYFYLINCGEEAGTQTGSVTIVR